MPDRAGEDRPGRDDPDALPDELWAAELRRREAAAAAAAAQAALDACTLCDTHGYRGTTPCDHTDHRPAAQRGMALIRSQMGWASQPPQTHHQNPGESHSGTKNDNKTTPTTTTPPTHTPTPDKNHLHQPNEKCQE